MILENDSVASKTTKENVKLLTPKAKVTREQTSEDSDNQGGNSEEAAVIVSVTKEVKAQAKSVVATITGKKVISLVSDQIPRRTRLLSKELGVIVKTVMNHKMTQLVSWRSTLKSGSDVAVAAAVVAIGVAVDDGSGGVIVVRGMVMVAAG
ncbi:hypothetical protein Tco_0631953, partial [Tanacetum coccineum]